MLQDYISLHDAQCIMVLLIPLYLTQFLIIKFTGDYNFSYLTYLAQIH